MHLRLTLALSAAVTALGAAISQDSQTTAVQDSLATGTVAAASATGTAVAGGFDKSNPDTDKTSSSGMYMISQRNCTFDDVSSPSPQQLNDLTDPPFVSLKPQTMNPNITDCQFLPIPGGTRVNPDDESV
ncbi:hypothetical protein HDU80_003690 [Chytriomyces hyalinus]|nr:hypothetical protein HDU80_003690 [Chytriomyces hyalinus]